MRRQVRERSWLRKSIDWLKRQLYRPWVTLLLPLVISLIVRGSMALARVNYPGGTIGNIGFLVLLWFVGFLAVRINSVSAVLRMVPQLIRLDGLAKPPGREVIIRFLNGDLEQLYQSLKGVLDPLGTEMGKSDLDYFTTSCFREGRGIYSGVESVLPSRYYDIYPDYLEEHKRNREKNLRADSYRILLATRAHLRRDWLRDKQRFEEFFEWHERNNVQLLHIAPDAARNMAEGLELRTTDVGLWERQYALLFTPLDSGNVRLSMATQGSGIFDSCTGYLERLRAAATAVECPPLLIEPGLAGRWEEYVFPDRRWTRLKPFLEQVLASKKNTEILDAAVGIGCETVRLLNDGWRIKGNEFEASFRDVARKYAANHGIAKLDLDGVDWTQLTRHYGSDRFGAILVLGNSICLLPNPSAVHRAIKEFYEALQPEGLLVIDERNFARIVTEEALVRENPAEHFPRQRVMYCGTTVRGCPMDVDKPEKRVIWACYENGSDAADWSSLQRKTIGEFELYAFDKGELRAILEDVGFEVVESYSDLATKPGLKEDATFITHVARKPAVPQHKENRVLLRDDCSALDGWHILGEGEVTLVEDDPSIERPYLCKSGPGDPNGVFRCLPEAASRPISLTTWLCHPAPRTGGPADRVAVEDKGGNGYGFCLTQGGKQLSIERRDSAHPTMIKQKTVDLLENTWYRYVLRILGSGDIELEVFDSAGLEVEELADATDETFNEFDRVTLRGGSDYYVRDLEVFKG